MFINETQRLNKKKQNKKLAHEIKWNEQMNYYITNYKVRERLEMKTVRSKVLFLQTEKTQN